MTTKAELLTRRMRPVEEPERFAALTMLPSREYEVTPEWVESAFLGDVVRLGTGAEDLDTLYPPVPSLPTIPLSSQEQQQFLASIDTTELITPSRERYRHLQQQFGLPAYFGVAEQTLSVLTHPFFRKGSFETMGSEFIQALHHQVQEACLYGSRLTIVLPTLPFKDQCAVTTRQSAETVDLGEHLFLLRLDLLARSVSAASRVKTSFNLVADGSVYADIFTLQGHNQVGQYFQNMQTAIQTLGLRETIKLTDLETIVAKEPQFGQVQSSIRRHLLEFISRQTNAGDRAWESLLRGMLFNCQLPTPFDQYEEFARLSHLSLAEIYTQHRQIFDQISLAGLEYASFLLTMRKLTLLSRHFNGPEVIRATVHPKRGQLGLQTLGSEVAPYNGVTSVNLAEFQRDSHLTNQNWYICQRFYRLIENPQSLTQLRSENGSIFCYLR